MEDGHDGSDGTGPLARFVRDLALRLEARETAALGSARIEPAADDRAAARGAAIVYGELREDLLGLLDAMAPAGAPEPVPPEARRLVPAVVATGLPDGGGWATHLRVEWPIGSPETLVSTFGEDRGELVVRLPGRVTPEEARRRYLETAKAQGRRRSRRR